MFFSRCLLYVFCDRRRLQLAAAFDGWAVCAARIAEMRRLVISRTKGLLRLRNLSYRMQVWHEYHYQATRIKNMEHAERYRTWLLGRFYAPLRQKDAAGKHRETDAAFLLL